MTHASVFSGIGGPEVAAKMMGWENAFHCEINPFGRAVLDYWFPESKSYEDITKTSFKEWRGKIDVLTGGFPCQPFSYAGKRGGRNDDRYLWPEMLRVIDEVRPTWVVGENVAGITTMVEGGVLTPLGSDSSLFAEGDELHRYELDQSYTIERICGDLEGIGYSVQSVLVPAAAVGAPHRRDRVFIIAHDDASNSESSGYSGHTGETKGKEGEERISQRDSLHIVGDATEVRSTMCQSSTDSERPGREEPKSSGRKENKKEDGAGVHDRVKRFGPDGFAPDPERRGSGTLPAPVHTGFADGDESLRDGFCGDASYSACGGCPSQEEGGSEQKIGGIVQEQGERGCETERTGGLLGLYGCDGLLPDRRWADFPTVPPIHRGNDGIPIRMDNITIPFTKWRTESLKAYGNAIVPQVMYRIFQSIAEAEKQTTTL